MPRSDYVDYEIVNMKGNVCIDDITDNVEHKCIYTMLGGAIKLSSAADLMLIPGYKRSLMPL